MSPNEIVKLNTKTQKQDMDYVKKSQIAVTYYIGGSIVYDVLNGFVVNEFVLLEK
jgi:hypothetical protein